MSLRLDEDLAFADYAVSWSSAKRTSSDTPVALGTIGEREDQMGMTRIPKVPVYVAKSQIARALSDLDEQERRLNERIEAGRSDAKRADAKRREIAVERKRIQLGVEKFNKRGK